MSRKNSRRHTVVKRAKLLRSWLNLPNTNKWSSRWPVWENDNRRIKKKIHRAHSIRAYHQD